MGRKLALAALLTLGAWIVPERPALAQSRYQTPTPRVSPWLNLFQREPGPLGSYLSNVRPQMQLNDTLGQYGNQLRAQGTGLRSLADRMNQPGEQGLVRPTGTGSVFKDYLHYYPALGGPSQAAARPRASAPRAQTRSSSYTGKGVTSRVMSSSGR